VLPARPPATRTDLGFSRDRGVRVAVALAASLALLAGLVATVAPNAFAQQGEQARLSTAREELAAIGEQLRAAESEEQEADRALADAEAALAGIERILNDVAAAVERQRASVRDAERRLAEVERDAEVLQDAFAGRIARLYMQGPELTIELLLSSGDADEAIARTVLLERLAEGDQVDLERLEAARIGVEAERERFAAEQAELETRLEEQRLVREEADALRSERALSAVDARARTEQLVAQQDDLEAEEERLEALIRAQQEEDRRRRAEAERQATAPSAGSSSSGGGGAVSSGGYAWPMCAPVTSEYGPRWGRVHRGIDQGASTGTPIGAAKAGRVIFAGWQGGYGNLTLIDHGDAVTAYAHQSRFAVGQGAQVSRGQTIGYVGSTGNSTGPHLHLEIRVNGSAVNPRQYLSGSPC
jgi:murein DD-endopeptidase MepM/ murein hydrolase activator NlpD